MTATPNLRRPVAVVLSRFPSVTETFILREVMEMERQGQPVRLVPLLREDPPVVHDDARPWVGRALYTPFISLPVLRSNLAAALRHPGRYFGLLLRLAAASLTSPRFLLATLAYFPKSVHLAGLLDREGICHVHAQFGSHPATAALVIASFSRASYSVTLHAHDLFVRSYRPFLETKLRRAAFVRVISHFNKRKIASLFPRIAPEKVHVVHVGIPTAEYAALDHEQPEPQPPAKWLLSVAALRDYKGLPVLVDACARLRDDGLSFRADVVGDGPMRTELERRIARAGLQGRLRLLGPLPQDRVRALLRHRPIFVLPSVIVRGGWMEGIPVALMEAMAAGAPVIASRLSGIPELVEDGRTGLLVEPGDADGLAAAISRLASDRGLASRMGALGREKVRVEFELESCTRQLLELIDHHNPPCADLLLLSRMVERSGPISGEVGVVGVAGVHVGADARVVRLLVPDKAKPRRLAVKEHLERRGQPRPPSERARHEFHVLARFARPSGKGHTILLVPRPVRLQEDDATLVMEACGGRPLSELLREARGGKREHSRARVAMEAAGAWLAAMQGCTSGETAPEEALRLWQVRVEMDLERCRTILPPQLPARVAARVAEVLCSTNVPVVGRHCDFWPGNVLVDEDRVTVLDFAGFGPGLPWEDAAYFLIQSELFFDYPLIRRRFATLRQAFLSGYGRAAPEHPDWAAFCAGAALQILSRTVLNPAPGLAGRRRVRRLRRVVQQVLA
jgi:glycosyltransferase involved in cell wall biosynthesis/aminoglycoside phosphotransferase (APT) family kinase protein